MKYNKDIIGANHRKVPIKEELFTTSVFTGKKTLVLEPCDTCLEFKALTEYHYVKATDADKGKQKYLVSEINKESGQIELVPNIRKSSCAGCLSCENSERSSRKKYHIQNRKIRRKAQEKYQFETCSSVQFDV